MTEKTDAQVVIGGRTYTLSGYESEEYLLRVAGYLNGKIDELNADPDYGRLPVDMRQLLLNLNIADDYFKAEARIEELQGIVVSRTTISRLRQGSKNFRVLLTKKRMISMISNTNSLQRR